nr:integrase, catalytic region, zinc finger, CCHC-type, peptidase aspartic, catalytic [Tanacetum cinerariifolium]
MKAFIQGKENEIKKLRMQISQLKETRSKADRTHDSRALDFQITQLTKKVIVLQEQNELFRVENAKIKQHYKELYDSIKITCAKHIEQTTALLTENKNLKVQINANLKCVTMDSVNQMFLHLVVQIVLWYLDLGCSKHMIRDRSRLKNFVKKFIETVRFGNDHFGAIMGYGDYVIDESVISKVYYMEGLGYNLFSVGSAFLLKIYSENSSVKWCGQKMKPYSFGSCSNDADYFKGTDVSMGRRPVPLLLMPGQISSGLVPNPVPTAPYVPPTNKELEILFQPMFDEYLEPPHVERPVSLTTTAPVPVISAGTPCSTTIDQDGPSPSHSSSTSALQPHISHQGVAAGSVGNKMHKAFPLPGESSHWQYKFPLLVKVVPTARRLKMPLPEVCTVIEVMMKKLPVKDRWQLH